MLKYSLCRGSNCCLWLWNPFVLPTVPYKLYILQKLGDMTIFPEKMVYTKEVTLFFCNSCSFGRYGTICSIRNNNLTKNPKM